MDVCAEAAVRRALALAAAYQRTGRVLDASVQSDIVRELYVIMDRAEAEQRRNDALRRAFNLLGSSTPVRMLFEAMRRFEDEIWPEWRWSAQLPEDATPLRTCLFDACMAASSAPLVNGSLNLPGERQLRRIVTSGYLNVTRGA